jgi:hypothetical protein
MVATHLDERSGAGELARAAYGGLQDSAPRAALLSLHARVEDVQPDSWEDPALVQIWFRGGADYVVPRADVGVFTLGAQPRDAGRCAALEAIADDVHRVLEGRTMHARDVYKALPQYERGMPVRAATVTGRIHLRWDASSILLIGAERPGLDVEEARVELARRFVRWFGPVTLKQFARWAAVDPSDAAPTWAALERELVKVTFLGEERVIHESKTHDAHIEGVRFIPHSDPLIKIDPEVVDVEHRLEVFPDPKKKAAFWPVSGVLLVDGEFAGSWARQQRRVTVNEWRKRAKTDRERVQAAALALPIAGRAAPQVRFHLESG